MADIKLYYFDIRGRGEFLRLLLHAGGQKFEDILVPRATWGPEAKKDTPYGQVPYMIYNGKKYGQSLAMASFFATKLGYMGKTDEDALRVNEVMQLGEDCRIPKIREWILEKDASKKAEKAQLLKEETFPRYLAYYEALLVDNGGTGFFVGDSVSMADLHVFDLLDTVLNIDPEALAAFPCQKKLRSNVEALPSLKAYLASRPKTVF